MFLESTTAPPPRKRRVAEGGPLPPRQCGSGRPAGLRARQRLIFRIFIYFIQHSFICGPSYSTASEDAGIEKKKLRKKCFFKILSLKKGVGSEVGSGSVNQRYGYAPKCHGSPTLVATVALAVRRSNHSPRSHPQINYRARSCLVAALITGQPDPLVHELDMVLESLRGGGLVRAVLARVPHTLVLVLLVLLQRARVTSPVVASDVDSKKFLSYIFRIRI
jgi:hypothetical protein